MKKLYSAANLQEAYLLTQRLAAAGIEAHVFNEHAQGGLGEIPVMYPEIWLADTADEARAQAVIDDYERASTGQALRPCPNCGEENPESFELCWKCGGPVDVRPGAVR